MGIVHLSSSLTPYCSTFRRLVALAGDVFHIITGPRTVSIIVLATEQLRRFRDRRAPIQVLCSDGKPHFVAVAIVKTLLQSCFYAWAGSSIFPFNSWSLWDALVLLGVHMIIRHL